MTRPLFALLVAAGACAPQRPDTVSDPMPSPSTHPTPSVADRSAMPLLPDVSERAMRVYRDAIVIDAHNDMPTNVLDDGYDPDVRNRPGFAVRSGEGHTDLPRLLESGITGQWMSAWIDASYALGTSDRSYQRAIQYLDWIRAWTDRHPELLFATTAADVERAKRENRVAIFIGVEGGHAIESSLDKLRDLYQRGARYMTLTWNNGTPWAGSSIGVEGTRTGGLTSLGRDVVREMNRLGMLVDLSHVSEATFYDAIATSTVPVIASHSSARALNDHPRNLTDEQLRAIARNGGVVNVNFFSRFIDADHRAAFERGETQLPQPPLAVLIDHFDHIATVAGVDHVGLGSDFDGVSALPAGMDDVTRLPRIAQGLLDRGYSEADVTKILGGNMMRVMRQVLDTRGAPSR